MKTTLLFILLLLASACSFDAQNGLFVDTKGTPADFANFVQRSLGSRCGSLDCHGDIDRPLRIYARNGLRLRADLRGRDESMSELTANILSIVGIDPEQDTLQDHLLLLKPLSVSAGGIDHVGGDVFADQRDGLYRCLHAWLRAGVQDDDGKTACAAALP